MLMCTSYSVITICVSYTVVTMCVSYIVITLCVSYSVITMCVSYSVITMCVSYSVITMCVSYTVITMCVSYTVITMCISYSVITMCVSSSIWIMYFMYGLKLINTCLLHVRCIWDTNVLLLTYIFSTINRLYNCKFGEKTQHVIASTCMTTTVMYNGQSYTQVTTNITINTYMLI